MLLSLWTLKDRDVTPGYIIRTSLVIWSFKSRELSLAGQKNSEAEREQLAVADLEGEGGLEPGDAGGL